MTLTATTSTTVNSRRRASRRNAFEDINYNKDYVYDASDFDESKVVKSKKKQKIMKNIAAFTTAAITTTTTMTKANTNAATIPKHTNTMTLMATTLGDGVGNDALDTSSLLCCVDDIMYLETTPTNDDHSVKIKPTYATATSLANTLDVLNFTTFSTTPILDKSIMQCNKLSNKEKAEKLFDKCKLLPCWDTDSATLDVMIIIIIVRRSPYIFYIVFWQILRCCLLILHLLNIGQIQMHHRIEPVIFANSMSRRNVLYSEAFQQLVTTVIIHKNQPMTLVMPRIITLGMDADNFEVVMLLLMTINEKLRIEVADSYGMPLIPMAREYEIMYTKSNSNDNSSHVKGAMIQ